MYEQIYEIIKNAIWSADAVLTSGQVFALEQVSLWLCLFTLLCPLFVTVAILVKCIKL